MSAKPKRHPPPCVETRAESPPPFEDASEGGEAELPAKALASLRYQLLQAIAKQRASADFSLQRQQVELQEAVDRACLAAAGHDKAAELFQPCIGPPLWSCWGQTRAGSMRTSGASAWQSSSRPASQLGGCSNNGLQSSAKASVSTTASPPPTLLNPQITGLTMAAEPTMQDYDRMKKRVWSCLPFDLPCMPKKHLRTSFIDLLTEGDALQGRHPDSVRARLDRFLNARFDFVVGCLVVLNTVSMFVQLEVEAPTEALAPVERHYLFEVANHVFNAVFICELLIKLFVKHLSYFNHLFNWVDALIVLATSLDLYVLSSKITGSGGSQNVSFMRLVRFVRVVRALRIIRTMGLFRQLRVLLNTIAMSFMSLFWSMTIFFIFMLMFSLLVCQLLQSVIEDPRKDDELRSWLYVHYGSSIRSFYTVFELTFSGCWPNYVRRIVFELGPFYAAIFILYIYGVVFAMVRIISALFLKDTLQAAANDADMVVHEKMKEMKTVRSKLAQIFTQADVSKDGYLSREELNNILVYPKVKVWLSVFGLDTNDTGKIFDMLDDGDGQISYDEFVSGIMRLKGASRAQDTLAIMKDCTRIRQQCEVTRRACEELKCMMLRDLRVARARI